MTMSKGIIGVEEFTALTKLMQSQHADRIRKAMLSLLDTGRQDIEKEKDK